MVRITRRLWMVELATLPERFLPEPNQEDPPNPPPKPQLEDISPLLPLELPPEHILDRPPEDLPPGHPVRTMLKVLKGEEWRQTKVRWN